MDGGADAFPPMPARRRPAQIHDTGARTKGAPSITASMLVLAVE